MKSVFINILLLLFLCDSLDSQQVGKKNPVIEEIVGQISADNLRHHVQALVGFKTRHTLSDTTSSTSGIGAARRWIKSEFDRSAASSEGRMSVEFQEFTAPPSQRIPRPAKIVNVIATIAPSRTTTNLGAEGAHANRVFILSGHYDSRASNALDSTGNAPGANDDGSGTAIVLELARAFSKYEFESAIKFVAFAGEEQGLIGSTHLAEVAKEQGWNIQAVLNNDIVGNALGGNGETESGYVRLFSEAYSAADTGAIFRQRNSLGLENDGASRLLARYVEEVAEMYVPNFAVRLIYRRDRFLRGGDHIPFDDRGFAAVRFTVAKENFDQQHQDVRSENGKSYGDLPEYMDFSYCANIARANAAALASLALAPEAPSNVRILTKGLQYDTEVRWRINPEHDLSGYIVKYRETTSPSWQHSIFTSDTTATLKVSKDDYLFAVQAVDKDGNPSLPSIPIPGR
ncbi:MAG TPA: M28 family metallopeptidase [Bacteroidota bacterium]|nr:M28 family metallopeptidase [Bacteroidota bacterium]